MLAETESKFRDVVYKYWMYADCWIKCYWPSESVINDRLLRVTLKSSADAALPKKTLEVEEGGQTGNASLPDSLWLRTPWTLRSTILPKLCLLHNWWHWERHTWRHYSFKYRLYTEVHNLAHKSTLILPEEKPLWDLKKITCTGVFINAAWTWKNDGTVRVKPDPWRRQKAQRIDTLQITHETRDTHGSCIISLCVNAFYLPFSNVCVAFGFTAGITDPSSSLRLRLRSHYEGNTSKGCWQQVYSTASDPASTRGNLHGLHHILQTFSSLFPVTYCLKYCSQEIIFVEKLNIAQL